MTTTGGNNNSSIIRVRYLVNDVQSAVAFYTNNPVVLCVKAAANRIAGATSKSQNASHVEFPGENSMNAKALTIRDVPRNFMSETGHTLADYSVALGFSQDIRGKQFTAIGSGVLVRKGKRFGILTARHCVHKPGPELQLGPTGTDVLFIVLQRGRSVRIQPQDVIKHLLVTDWTSRTTIICPFSRKL